MATLVQGKGVGGFRILLTVQVERIEDLESGVTFIVDTTSYKCGGQCRGDSPAPAYSEVMDKLTDFLTRCSVDPKQKES